MNPIVELEHSVDQKIIHLKTQDNQPYGSERRCCEECGIMIWGDSSLPDGHDWTNSRAGWGDDAILKENGDWMRCTNYKEDVVITLSHDTAIGLSKVLRHITLSKYMDDYGLSKAQADAMFKICWCEDFPKENSSAL